MAIDLKLIDKLLADYKKPEDIIGENGLLKQLTKALLERELSAGVRKSEAVASCHPIMPVGDSFGGRVVRI
ncbi:MAG: hypothetical protein WBE37_30160, partial [Bryobacteraceae bacterium]